MFNSMVTSMKDGLSPQHWSQTSVMLIFIVYVSMFLDNILLTIVVPIIPDYLYNLEETEEQQLPVKEDGLNHLVTTPQSQKLPRQQDQNSVDYMDDLGGWIGSQHERQDLSGRDPEGNITDPTENLKMAIGNSSLTLGILARKEFVGENARVAILLSSKAVVQLVVNPIVGILMSRTGHQIPLFIGSLNLLLSSLLFALTHCYAWLLVARSLQGIASACIGVAGMCLVAERCPEEGGSRGKVMGVVLGATALGVLLGYPMGGLLYDFTGGKKTPFLVVATLVLLDTVLQLLFLDLKPIPKKPVLSDASKNVPSLLRNWRVLVTVGAIWMSTSAMSILEPCLPIWLMDTIKPKRWLIGMVFIPDSLGYLLGTNFLGGFAFHVGRWKVATIAMLLVGISAVMVASSTTMGQLVGPHFGIGLGIGAVDSALVPLLALLVEYEVQDKNPNQQVPDNDDGLFAVQYATVYTLQQTAVSLAYSLGPILGGELVHLVGFPWLMRTVGILNIIYSPLLFILNTKGLKSLPDKLTSKSEDKETQNIIMPTTPSSNYRTSINEERSWMPFKLKFSSYHRFYDLDESD